MSQKKKTEKSNKDEVSELRTQNSELQAQLDAANDALLRERADAMNVRKRAEEEKLAMAGYFKASVVKELLPAIDNLERAVAAAQQNQEAGNKNYDELQKGVAATLQQFMQILERLGVERIKTVGEPFDPELHEAVSHEEGDSGQETVSEELQSGYKIGDEIIRHAMVQVKS